MRLFPFVFLVSSTLTSISGEPCKAFGTLEYSPTADFFVVSYDTPITQRFYLAGRCWIREPNKVHFLSNDENYSNLNGSVTFVLSRLKEFEEIQEVDLPAKRNIIVLELCSKNTECVTEIKRTANGTQFIKVLPREHIETFLYIVTGDVAEKRKFPYLELELYSKLEHDAVVKAGVVVILIITFFLLSCGVGCHSLWILSLVYDDFEYWRENQDAIEFRPLQERQPTPVPSQLVNATPVASEEKLDSTQASTSDFQGSISGSSSESLVPLHLLGSPYFEPSRRN